MKTLEELQKQFEELSFNRSLDFSKENGDYLDYTTFERFNGFFLCADVNNLIDHKQLV